MASLDALRADLQALARRHALLLPYGALAVSKGRLRHLRRQDEISDLGPVPLPDLAFDAVAALVEDAHGHLPLSVGPAHRSRHLSVWAHGGPLLSLLLLLRAPSGAALVPLPYGAHASAHARLAAEGVLDDIPSGVRFRLHLHLAGAEAAVRCHDGLRLLCVRRNGRWEAFSLAHP